MDALAVFWTTLLEPYRDSNLATYLSVAISAFVVFFSISLVPFQHYAASYTPVFFQYLRKHRGFVAGYGISLVIVLGMVLLPFASATLLREIMGAAGLILTLVIIAILWRITIALLDPFEFLLPTLEKEITESLDRAIDALDAKQQTDLEKLQDLDDMMQEAMASAEQLDPKTSKYRIRRNDIADAFSHVVTLKEFAARSLSEGQSRVFLACLDTLARCISAYWERRKDYSSLFDDLAMDLADELRDVIAVADSASNIHGHRAIWAFVRSTSIDALRITAVGNDSADHSVARPLQSIVETHTLEDLGAKRIDSAYESIRALGLIGCAHAQHRYAASAAQIAKGIAERALYADALGIPVVSNIGRVYLAEIFYNMVLYRRLFINYDHPYQELIEAYNTTIEKGNLPVGFGSNDPIFWWDADLFKDRSIASIIRACLWPVGSGDEKEYDDVVSENLTVAGELLALMQKHYDKNHTTESSYSEQQYQTGLWLLGFLHHEIALDLLLTVQSAQVPNERNIDRAQELLDELMEWMAQRIARAWTNRADRTLKRGDLLHGLLSLAYLRVHFSKKFGLDDANSHRCIDRIISGLVASRATINASSAELHAMWRFGQFLSGVHPYQKLGRRVAYLSRRAIIVGHHQPPRRMRNMSFIKRPILTFDARHFDAWDTETSP